MPKPHPNDISIGEDQWITALDVTALREDLVDIDPWMESLEPFWTALETNCVAECCGIDAFSLWPEDLQMAAKLANAEALTAAIIGLQVLIESSSSDAFVSSRLNNIFHKAVLLHMLNHILKCFKPSS